jgi:hypothetical protein
MNTSKARLCGGVAVLTLVFVLVQAALAAEKQPIKFNAADQAAAKAVTLKKSDLGAGWKGGATKPDLSSDDLCPSKVSDLVLTGAAKSDFTGPGVMITSQTDVLESSAMVAADWRRTVGNAAYMACSRREYIESDARFKVVSFKKVAFPKLTRYAARYRLVADYGDPQSSVRVLVDVILLGHGRTEISLMLSTPYADRAVADAAERRLAKILVSRITV